MRVKNFIPFFGNGTGSGKFHSRLSGRELEAVIPGNSRDREFPLMVDPDTSKLGLAMWKFLAMRYHSASMRKYAHFHITVVKKNHHFGPIFWPIFDRFLTIFVKNFNRFCRILTHFGPILFYFWPCFFCLLCAYRFCLPNRIRICAYVKVSDQSNVLSRKSDRWK